MNSAAYARKMLQVREHAPGCNRNDCKGCGCRKNLSDHDAIRQHMDLPATETPRED